MCSKATLGEIIKKDIIGLNLNEHLAFDRAQWSKRIHVIDPN